MFFISIGKCHGCSYSKSLCAAQCRDYRDELWRTLLKRIKETGCPDNYLRIGYCHVKSPYRFCLQKKDEVFSSREELLAEIVQFNIAHPELAGVKIHIRWSHQ